MKEQIVTEIERLDFELEKNHGIVPDSWRPWLSLIKFALYVAEIFTPNYVDVIIDRVLEAIALYEQETKGV